MKTISQQKLKEHLHYDPVTGLFTRLKHFNSKRVGEQAGSITKRGYTVIRVDYTVFLGHRLAYLYVHGYMPKEIDHIDRNPKNNRISNLRSVTRQENMRNKECALGEYRGIWYNKKTHRFQVYATIDKKKVYVGTFETKEEAKMKRQIKENRLF